MSPSDGIRPASPALTSSLSEPGPVNPVPSWVVVFTAIIDDGVTGFGGNWPLRSCTSADRPAAAHHPATTRAGRCRLVALDPGQLRAAARVRPVDRLCPVVRPADRVVHRVRLVGTG